MTGMPQGVRAAREGQSDIEVHAERTILYRQLVLFFSPVAEGVASSPSARHISRRFFSNRRSLMDAGCLGITKCGALFAEDQP